MRSSIAIAAAIVGAVQASPAGYGYGGYGGYGESSVPVVYSTSLVTVYSCGPEVTDCPAKYHSTPAAYVASSTKAPAYSAPAYSAPAYSAPAYSAPAYSAPAYSAPSYNVSSVPYVTKTISKTVVHTITSCAAYVTNCPAHSTIVTTEVDVYTTVCPATEGETYPTETPVAPASSSVYYPEETSTPCAESSTVTVVVPVSSAYYPVGTGVTYPSGTGVWGTASSTGYVHPTATYPPQFTGAASHANAGMAVAGLGALAALFL